MLDTEAERAAQAAVANSLPAVPVVTPWGERDAIEEAFYAVLGDGGPFDETDEAAAIAALDAEEATAPFRPRDDDPPPWGDAWAFEPSGDPRWGGRALGLRHLGQRAGLFVGFARHSELRAATAAVRVDAEDPRLRCAAWMRRATDLLRDLTRHVAATGWVDAWERAPVVVIDAEDGAPVAWCEGDSGAAGFLLRLDPAWLGAACGRCTPCASADAAAAQGATTWVYFVQAGEDGPIKVGYSNHVEGRLASLQTAHHAPLRVLLKVPGGLALEAALHAALAPHRLRGEWFRPAPEVLRLAAEMGGGR